MADALGVPVIREPVYPYEESPPLDDVMSYLIESSIQWGSDPRITFAELAETTYIFFRVACHSLWLIFHLHTIPFERCLFLYAFVSVVFISFPHLILRSLNEVYRSSVVAHALILPIFIHRILLFLGLVDFLAGEPVHVITPIGVTFLRQRAAYLRVGFTHPRNVSFGTVPPSPSSIGVDTAEASGVAAAAADVPPSTTSDDSDIRRMLDHVLTVQAAYGQSLVDVLDEIRGLCAELA